MLQQHISDLLLIWAPQQQKEVVGHQSGRKSSERAVGVAKLGGQLVCVAHGLAHGIREENKRKTSL